MSDRVNHGMLFSQEGRPIFTLEQFIIARQKEVPEATGELSQLLRDIALACKVINREVSKAGLVDILGLTGKRNVHGENVKKLDIFAHYELESALTRGKVCSVVGSEESDGIIPIKSSPGKYVVLLDPLDGSSNIDVNVSIGTIFSIFRRSTSGHSPEDMLQDSLQPGYRQVAAGYVLYGSSTMLVLTTGKGVHGFTLDPGIGEFLYSHPSISMPPRGKYYSTNQGYSKAWSKGLQAYVDYLQEQDPESGRPYSLRYIGTLLADVHRTLFYGGIFIYPRTATRPYGKLRLMYECNPMALIVEQAGGKATDGVQRILDICPQALHQRSPLFMGSRHDVDEAMGFLSRSE